MTTKTQHTPGPWRVELEGYDSDYGYVIERAGIRAENGLFVADVEPHDEAHADIAAIASLIAAAPDMLAELQNIVAMDYTVPKAVRDRCAALIAKAVRS